MFMLVFMFSGKPASTTATVNPFSDLQAQPKPVFNTAPPKPSMNEIKQTPFMGSPQFNVSASQPTINPNTLGFATTIPYTSSNQFGSTSPSFRSNGIFGASAQPVQDPWKPVRTNNQLNDPWMKPGETANPFLS